ncbi:MAG TPA: antibiotic biosynthesis monooxygenase [Thermoanaerobaculia bacterium]
MFTTVWKFVVRDEAIAEFERHYGAEGTWALLFRKAHGYLGTELYRGVANAGEYVTVDRWIDEAAYRAFREEYAAEYDSIDRECEELTESEEKIA